MYAKDFNVEEQSSFNEYDLLLGLCAVMDLNGKSFKAVFVFIIVK